MGRAKGPSCDVYGCTRVAVDTIYVPLAHLGEKADVGDGCRPHVDEIGEHPERYRMDWDVKGRSVIRRKDDAPDA